MAKPTGPKEWQPRSARLRDVLLDLEKRTIDTSKGPVEPMRVICAADPQKDGTLVAWHVTDNPEVVKDVLRRGVDLQEMRPWGDLCGGLYVSACPDIWKRRSRKKWDFIEALTPRQARALADLIVQDLWEKFERGYITEWEHQRARRDVEHYWLVRGNWNVLALVAGQPWNVNIQELAREGGIADPFNPAVVEVVFTGRYLDAADGVFEESGPLAAEHSGISEAMLVREDVCRYWRAMGWDGAFTRAGMGTYAELVVWNADRIRRFGELTPEAFGMGGNPGMGARAPYYRVPEEIQRLVREGFFREFTQSGDNVRSFGRISPGGFEARLWVDREKEGIRRMTGFRYTVSLHDPEGDVLSETSGEDVDKALDTLKLLFSDLKRFGPKEWRPGPRRPRARLYQE